MPRPAEFSTFGLMIDDGKDGPIELEVDSISVY